MWEREKGRRRRRRKKTSGRGIPASCLWSQRLQSPPTPPPAGPARHLHRQSTDLFPSWWQLTITSSLSPPPPFEFAFASLSPYPFTISYQVSTALLCSSSIPRDFKRRDGERAVHRPSGSIRSATVVAMATPVTAQLRFNMENSICKAEWNQRAQPLLKCEPHPLTHSLYSIIMPSFSLRLWTFLYSRFYF